MLRSLTLLITCCIISPQVASALEISFSPEAEVNTPHVTLGDITSFNQESPLSLALATKHIAQAPKPGETISIDANTIKSTLLKSFPINEDIIWNGSKTVLVTRKGISITPAAIEQTIADYLEERNNDLPVAEYSFIARELPLPFVIPTGEIQIDIIPSDPNIIGSRRFSLVYRVDGRTVKNISVRGKLQALASVAILTQNVKRGAILRPEMVQLQTKDLSKLRDPCTDLRQILGKRLTRSLRSGSILNVSSIEFPPLIHKGQLVKILINHNGLHLTATGISSMNGKQDQIIRVMNSGSRKVIFCKVKSPGLVEVQI